MMRLSTLFTFTFVMITACAFAQSPLSKTSSLYLFDDLDQIQTFHLDSQLEGYTYLGEVYSKARGVTTLSAINNINNRALRKLKTEAAMLGGEAVFIVNNYQKGVQFYAPVQVTYSAMVYTRNVLTKNQVEQLVAGKTFTDGATVIYSRNAFSPKVQSVPDQTDPFMIENITEKNGKLFMKLTRDRTEYNYHIVSATPQKLVLAHYDVPGKVLRNLILEVQVR
ncbi:MAG TPA: hypothetical protein VK921_09430 [Anditalea sp.]|nr:hypothetical protein [Anditalea sp.]